MRSAIVTGGRGFVGRYLVSRLRASGVSVTTIGRRQSAEATHIVLEQWDSGEFARILEDIAPDCIFHLVGAARGTPEELEHINVSLTRRLLQAVKSSDLRPVVVVAGSAAEYGSAIVEGEPVRETARCMPLSAYGATKYAQTCQTLEFGAATGNPVLVARIFNPIGAGMPRHLAIGDFAHQIASIPGNRGTLRVGNIDVSRDMIDIEHVAALLCRLAVNPHARGVVNLCSGEAVSLRELVEMLIADSGREIDIEVDQARVRANDFKSVIGSTDLLTKLGCRPPPTDFPAVIARVWREMEELMPSA